MTERSQQALDEKVYDGEQYRPFGEFTADDAEGRAAELRNASGFGPTMRVRPVAQGWGELAKLLTETGARTVADLGPEQVEGFAEKLWVIPPQRGLVSDPPPPRADD